MVVVLLFVTTDYDVGFNGPLFTPLAVSNLSLPPWLSLLASVAPPPSLLFPTYLLRKRFPSFVVRRPPPLNVSLFLSKPLPDGGVELQTRSLEADRERERELES